LLHRRSKVAPVLYDRHTPEHHMVYVTDDMAIRNRREMRLVLIPAYGILLLFGGVLLPAAALWLAGLRNVALLFVAVEMAYVLSYEWLHLSYHLPEDSVIGRRRLIRLLRRHHAVHHDPRLMQRWNFNVTVPLWDWIQGTLVKSVGEALERERRQGRHGARTGAAAE
jgi:sterol desaturase/sphingolipid hydroxylase (fatty acid hydroxylase superfamily)